MRPSYRISYLAQMVIHVLLHRKVISVRAVADGVPLHDAKLIALRAAVAAQELTASEALQVTFEIAGAAAAGKSAVFSRS